MIFTVIGNWILGKLSDWRVLAVAAAVIVLALVYWKASTSISDYFQAKCDTSKLEEAAKADQDRIHILEAQNAALKDELAAKDKAKAASQKAHDDNVKQLEGLGDGEISPVLRKSLELLGAK